jgi:two-component system chemotaxis response regulator CheY
MQNRTILIVDDSAIARRMLKSCLPRDRSFTVFEADDGDTGLAAFRDRRPDITFLDLTMPRVNGLDCLADIRSSCPDALVIVATADVQLKSLRRALDLGAMEVLRKPPTRESVRAVLERAESKLEATSGARP